MRELIDRQQAIDAVQRHREGVLGSYEYDEGVAFVYAAAHNHIIDVIKKLPSAQPEQQWIPCSERAPMVSGEFLVTLTDGDGEWVSTAEWNVTFGGRWQDIFIDDGYRDISNVIAWMPLPEPYRERREE